MNFTLNDCYSPTVEAAEVMDAKPRVDFPSLALQPRPGRPSKLSPEVTAKIIFALERCSFIRPACEAAGVSYQTVRKWILQAEQDEAQGVDSEYVVFRDALQCARNRAEVAAAGKLSDDPDWRAAAFLLERGFRERWGKNESQASVNVTLVLSDKAQETLVELLALANAKQIETQPIEVTEQSPVPVPNSPLSE